MGELMLSLTSSATLYFPNQGCGGVDAAGLRDLIDALACTCDADVHYRRQGRLWSYSCATRCERR